VTDFLALDGMRLNLADELLKLVKVPVIRCPEETQKKMFSDSEKPGDHLYCQWGLSEHDSQALVKREDGYYIFYEEYILPALRQLAEFMNNCDFIVSYNFEAVGRMRIQKVFHEILPVRYSCHYDAALPGYRFSLDVMVDLVKRRK